MEIEAVVRRDALSCEMCSSRFYPTLSGSVLFPKPGKIIAKGLCDIKRRGPEQQLEWLRAVATGLEQYGSIDPLLAALAVSVRRFCGEGAGTDIRSEYMFYNSGNTKTSWLNVCIYYDHHYGLCASQVRHAIEFLGNVELGTMITDSVITHICAVDFL